MEISTNQRAQWCDWKTQGSLNSRHASYSMESGMSQIISIKAPDLTSPCRGDFPFPLKLQTQSELPSTASTKSDSSESTKLTKNGLTKHSELTVKGLLKSGQMVNKEEPPIVPPVPEAGSASNSPSSSSMNSSKGTPEGQQLKKHSREGKKAISSTTSLTQSNSDTGTSTPLEPQHTIFNGVIHNTLRKTRSDMKVIHRYLIQVKHDNRDIHLIPFYELDQYIQEFVLTAKKKDGHEYEPESLKAFIHSLERHLKYHGYPHSVLKGNAFTGTRVALNQRLNELRALSRSTGSARATGHGLLSTNTKRSPISENACGLSHTLGVKRASSGNMSGPGGLYQSGILGKDNPQAVLNSLWLINRTQFNIGGTQRHRNLVWGQFQLITDEMGTKAIKFTPLFESAEVRYCRGTGGPRNCTNSAAAPSKSVSTPSDAKRQQLPFDCVDLFEFYASLRPPEARGVSEPFYLCPETMWEQTGQWFKTNATGSQLLARIPRLLGLKQTREPAHPNLMLSAYGMCSEATENNVEKLNKPIHQFQFPQFLAQPVGEKQLDQCHDRLEEQINMVYASLRPNIPSLMPFLFPAGMGTPVMPTLLPPPASLPLSPSLYSPAMIKTPPLASLPFPCIKDYPLIDRNASTGFEQEEADDLSQPISLKTNGSKTSNKLGGRQINSPQSCMESGTTATGLDDSPSPVETESWPISNTWDFVQCPTLDTENKHMTLPLNQTQASIRKATELNKIDKHSPLIDSKPTLKISDQSNLTDEPIDMSGPSSPLTHSTMPCVV